MNNSKTNSNNINTGYLALDPTANKYLSGSGWEIFFSSFFKFFYVFLFSFCFLLCFYMCFFECKCKNLKRLGENNNKQK